MGREFGPGVGGSFLESNKAAKIEHRFRRWEARNTGEKCMLALGTLEMPSLLASQSISKLAGICVPFICESRELLGGCGCDPLGAKVI